MNNHTTVGYKIEPLKLDLMNVLPSTKGKLYIKYGASRAITTGGKNDLFHAVKAKNIAKIIAKRNQENIIKIIFRMGQDRQTKKRDEKTIVLYTHPDFN